MRFVSNTSSSIDYHSKNSKLKVHLSNTNAFSIVSGAAKVSHYFPDKLGWALQYVSDNPQRSFSLGYLRVATELTLSGFVGASLAIEAQTQVVTLDKEKQVLMGANHPAEPFRKKRMKGAEFHKAIAQGDDGIDASAEAFAGAKVELGFKGALQWLQPRSVNQRYAGVFMYTNISIRDEPPEGYSTPDNDFAVGTTARCVVNSETPVQVN